jgi:phosphoribosylglycinamide formyltransferase-1
MLNIAVFGSGRGSNFRAILTAIEQGRIAGARIVLVISNNSGAGILEVARRHGLKTLHISRMQFATEEEFVDTLCGELSSKEVNFIALAGYMKRLPSRIVALYRNRIVNIHPALLPKYGGKGMYGMHVHEAVIASGDRVSGATVHLVDEEYDRGPVVLQREVAVQPEDTPERLAERVLEVEHELYPEAIRLFAEGRITLDERGVLSIIST